MGQTWADATGGPSPDAGVRHGAVAGPMRYVPTMPGADPGPVDEVDTITAAGGVRVGRSAGTPPICADEFDVVVTTRSDPPAPWVHVSGDEVERLVERISEAPAAAAMLVELLRMTESLDVDAAVVAESLAYSVLQHSHRFQQWCADRPSPSPGSSVEAPPVEITRAGPRLDICLQRPDRHNAVDTHLRDGLVEALDLVAADPTIAEVHLRGTGPSFCSGGDLAEFGTAPDAATAHRIRMSQHIGLRVHRHAAVVTAHLHGSCIGAGIEIPAFAGIVRATLDTRMQLPELSLGLIPGAGGTVGIPRRIGRHRAAWMALSGQVIDAPTALGWGLIDAIEPS